MECRFVLSRVTPAASWFLGTQSSLNIVVPPSFNIFWGCSDYPLGPEEYLLGPLRSQLLSLSLTLDLGQHQASKEAWICWFSSQWPCAQLKQKRCSWIYYLIAFLYLTFFFNAAPSKQISPKVLISNSKARENILLICQATILIWTRHTVQVLSSQFLLPDGV